MNVGFNLSYLGVLVVRRRHVRSVVLVSTCAVAEHGFRDNGPALWVTKDAGVFLLPGVEENSTDLSAGRIDERRRAEQKAVLGCEFFVHGIHRPLGLGICGRFADDCPRLRVEEDRAFGVRLRTDDAAILAKRTHEPIAIPTVFLNVGRGRRGVH